ncbi:MAG: helix-turn-helix domain-containing protein [Flavobacteriales bacterium]|nr:helix-turn-helix domain-containing protein [Flavobacteriales bacterium]
MALSEEQIRLIFGLKLKQLRDKNGLSLFGLAKKTGLSKSYLNEIEKGKKYPKPDKIVALGAALETSFEDMVNMKLTGKMAPLSDIILSGVLKEIPLNLFGIDEGRLLDIIASAPDKTTTFIGTLFEIARIRNISREDFFLSALRSYQESHQNHFTELEAEVRAFIKRYQIDIDKKIESIELEEILDEEFGYIIDYESLNPGDHLGQIRSVFNPKEKRLMIAKEVTETQRVFILAKELGYCHLEITARPLTFSWIKFEGFEDVLNNFKASYFAGALILNEKKLVGELKELFTKERWSSSEFLQLMLSYTNSAETFFQRLTNLLPRHFGITDMFFLRFGRRLPSSSISLTKEYHIGSGYQPRAHQDREHYCRRWISTDLLSEKNSGTAKSGITIGIQRNEFEETGAEHLVIAASNADPFNKNWKRSVCIGIGMNNRQKKKINFESSPKISQRVVGNTCERCSVKDCNERISAPIILEKEQTEKAIQEQVDLILSGSN